MSALRCSLRPCKLLAVSSQSRSQSTIGHSRRRYGKEGGIAPLVSIASGAGPWVSVGAVGGGGGLCMRASITSIISGFPRGGGVWGRWGALKPLSSTLAQRCTSSTASSGCCNACLQDRVVLTTWLLQARIQGHDSPYAVMASDSNNHLSTEVLKGSGQFPDACV